MCGIIAYVGTKPCKQTIIHGLSRLEYRGYDSAGLACIDEKHKHISYHKYAGTTTTTSPVQRLEQTATINGHIGIGHTRWATHGVVNEENTHPHFNCQKNIAVVHNGIIEGHEKIRKALIEQGHDLHSTTDTEVAAHLLGNHLKKHNDLKTAVMEFSQELHGAYAFVFLLEKYPEKLLIMRRRSPLVVGIGENEMFAASDYLAFSDKTNKVVFLPDDSFALLSKNNIELYGFDGKALQVIEHKINSLSQKIDKQGFDHYMLKEIYEQKHAITRTISFYNLIGSTNKTANKDDLTKPYEPNYTDAIWRQLTLNPNEVGRLKSINMIGAGTSWHAARIAQFFFEYICKIPTRVHLASEFRYMPFFKDTNSTYIMISQSGETADTLEALKLISGYDQHSIALTNVASSSMVREAQGFLPMQAGPEISVASTKAFSTQLATLFWLANRIALERGIIDEKQMHDAEGDLFIAAEILEASIENYKLEITQTLASQYAKYDRFIFLGRHISYPFAMEAALKLKEISYVFAQPYPAGELKHGPIALIDEKTPIFIFSVLDDLIYQKLVSNAHEVKARHGHLVVFAFEGQDELIKAADTAFVIPRVNPLLAPLAMTGLMQFFVYHITCVLGCPIDKPRNLAKSVTVE
ncbi:MAG: glutamine--fructose-6-phosphate transaminase (isomerizing) [Epsilonproteobacteria bacterium]|nr:glutamine--fructose-6-phosphate transaminase (isomerizing) [Campylobacterota bacterium]